MLKQKDIDRYIELKKIESDAKAERTQIEDKWNEDNKNKTEGKKEQETKTHGLKISFKGKTEIDQEMAADFDKKYTIHPFKAKYSLDKKLYDSIEKLNEEAHSEFKKAVTVKPARPAFEIKEKK